MVKQKGDKVFCLYCNFYMKIYQGDNLHILKTLEDNSIDSIVTDPPYGLSFMNKKWDHSVPSVEFWKECLRVLKPGGHVLSFGGTRTYHRMAVNIEDAGFEIRDQIQWLYGSGFPKSQNVSKMIDKKFGCEREVVGKSNRHNSKSFGGDKYGKFEGGIPDETKPSSDQAKQWDGFGTALKPSNEPIVLARKPLSEKTIVDNILKWGTGAINIDGCRIKYTSESDLETTKAANQRFIKSNNENFTSGWKQSSQIKFANDESKGRWPANIILDEQAAFALDEQSGILKSGAFSQKGLSANTEQPGGWQTGNRTEKDFGPANSGGASRFFYVAKTSKSERNRGLEDFPDTRSGTERMNNSDGRKAELGESDRFTLTKNHHPTVKPIKLMEYLVKLVTPPNGSVLDPFMGSGSTGVACKNLGFDFVGMELDSEYFKIAEARINGR